MLNFLRRNRKTERRDDQRLYILNRHQLHGVLLYAYDHGMKGGIQAQYDFAKRYAEADGELDTQIGRDEGVLIEAAAGAVVDDILNSLGVK